jgi:deoxycytidylate deaminase
MTNEYPYLPEERTIGYVPADNEFMREAKRVRDTMSTDRNHSTGAVVVLNGEIVGRGANQSALKNDKLLDFHKNTFCVRRFLKIKTGTKYWLCPGCSSSRHHGETRAVKDALKNKGSIQGADLYLYGHWWCCRPCWDEMIKAGIDKVYLVEGATELFKR